MTLRLILTRHAKSDWDDPLLDDHDRPLNLRGLADAPRLGVWLAEQGLSPGQALVSTARRATETWAGMSPALPGCAASFHAALYHAEPSTILKQLAKAETETVLIVAHNPGIAVLSEAMLSQAPDHHRFAVFPTGATLIAEFDTDSWRNLRPGTGRAVGFTVPRDLR